MVWDAEGELKEKEARWASGNPARFRLFFPGPSPAAVTAWRGRNLE
jgi:hypothetical protein